MNVGAPTEVMVDVTDRAEALAAGNKARGEGDHDLAAERYREAAGSPENPYPDALLRLARALHDAGRDDEAATALLRVVDTEPDFTTWHSAGRLLEKIWPLGRPPAQRDLKVAVLGSYTTAQLVTLLKLTALRLGMATELFEGGFGQYQQLVLDPESPLDRFAPDVVVLAVHHGEARLPGFSGDPDEEEEAEVSRWTGLWEAIADRWGARVVTHNFAIPPAGPFGHLSTRLAGSHEAMLSRLNARLGGEAGDAVSIVDSDRLAALVGKRTWFDDRYWHISKQAVSLRGLPTLALHMAGVMAADAGLTKKCLVVDLDNTLWGGVIGEDGLSGIELGAGPAGEAFVDFQRYLRALKDKGIVLAVSSKNNDADAREPFLEHPDMVLNLDDFAVFRANWDTKARNLREIAAELNLGLDSMVFVDDNPMEREMIRQLVPEVEVIRLPEDPSGYVDALSQTVWFETSSFTREDAQKTEQYRARAEITRLESESSSLEEFYAGLEMIAEIEPFDDFHLPRIAQLIGKTNQFNLTTKRHSMERVRAMANDPGWVTLYLKLRDRFADHGLVAVAIARVDGETLDIDTWLMSCRVIGRTVEQAMLARLCGEALARGCAFIRGTYLATPKNSMVADLYPRLGFEPQAGSPPGSAWLLDLGSQRPSADSPIRVTSERREPAYGSP